VGYHPSIALAACGIRAERNSVAGSWIAALSTRTYVCWGARFCTSERIPGVAAYSVNDVAVRHAKRLIDTRQYVLRSRWQDVQPRAREQNAYLNTHSWDEYAAWHLGLTEGAPDEAKARYAFVYGDFRRLHRMGLIACHYRAAEWRHKEIELAAHELLQYLDQKTA
jgi:hypothetical protein